MKTTVVIFFGKTSLLTEFEGGLSYMEAFNWLSDNGFKRTEVKTLSTCVWENQSGKLRAEVFSALSPCVSREEIENIFKKS